MRLDVNGRPRDLLVPDHESLLTTLRERLSLTGSKLACDRGECGACTVLVDGQPVYSCITLTHAVEGARVRTIEGVAPHGGPLHAVQQAFIDCDAVQCGYCTPGQIMSAIALVERSPSPTDPEIDEAMSGNLCRCGTYPKIRAAVHQAAAAMRAGGIAP